MALKFRIQVKTKRKRKPASRLRREYKADFQNVMRKIGMKGVNNIKSEITKRNLIKTGEMIQSTNYKMTPKGVRFIVDDPAPYLEKGIRKHQMRYLMKSKGPIPIQVDEANVIFRWASPKSMRKGHWKHPGFTRGKGFMRAAVKRTREQVVEDIRRIAMKAF